MALVLFSPVCIVSCSILMQINVMAESLSGSYFLADMISLNALI